HLGLDVNRLIRISYGPFQLGEIEVGKGEEVKTRVLREQLGEKVIAQAGSATMTTRRRAARSRSSPRARVRSSMTARAAACWYSAPAARRRGRATRRRMPAMARRVAPSAAIMASATSSRGTSRASRWASSSLGPLLAHSLRSLPPCGGGTGRGVPHERSVRVAPPSPTLPRKGEGSALPARQGGIAPDARGRRTAEGPQHRVAFLARYPPDRGPPARVRVQHPRPRL